MATIYAKTASDKALILGTREALVYPFTAPNWADLRLGLFVSATKAAVNDDTTGLAETFDYNTSADRVWIGFKDNSNDFPNVATSSFAGCSSPAIAQGLSLVSGLWILTAASFLFDGTTGVRSIASCTPDFPNGTYSAGYSSLIIVKLTRSGSSYTSSLANIGNTANGIYSSTPTVASIRTAMRTNTAYINTTQTMSSGIQSVFVYWPFYNSRLRVHSMVLEKFA